MAYTPGANPKSAEAEANFDSQLHRLQDAHAIGKAQNKYQGQVGNQNYTDQLARMKTGYDRSWQGFKSNQAERGIAGSGFGNVALLNRVSDYDRDVNELGMNRIRQQQGLDLQSQGLDVNLFSGTMDVNAMRTARLEAIQAGIGQ